MTRRRVGLAIGVVLAVLLVVLPSAVVLLLASTEAGLQRVAQLVNSRVWGRATIRAEGARGTLARGFTLEHLVVDNPWVHLDITGLAGEVELLPLLWQTIALPNVQMRTGFVQLLSPPASARDSSDQPNIRFMPGALSVRADRLAMAEGSLVLANGTRFDVTGAEIATVVRQREIRLLRGGLELPNLRLQANGRLLAGWPLGLNGKARFNIHAEGQPDWIINSEFDGDLDELPLTGNVTTPFRADFQGQGIELTRNWRFTGAAAVEDFDVAAWGGGDALGPIKGTLSLLVNRTGYAARGELEPAGLAAGPFDTDIKVTYADRRVGIERASFVHKASGAQAAVRGAVFIDSDTPLRLDLGGDWHRFRWPLVGDDVATRSPEGVFTLQGTRPWAVTASGDLAPADLAPMPFAMRGTLWGDRIEIANARLSAWGGQAQLHGDAVWSPSESWKLAGTVRELDTSRLRSDLPGRVSFGFDAIGRGFGDAGEIDLRIADLAGRLRGAPARGSGALFRRGPLAARSWRFDDLRLQAGTTQLELDGTTAAPRRLDFELNSPDISLFSPELRGRVRIQGVLGGDDAHPALRMTADARDLESGAGALRLLRADVDVDLAPGGRTRGTLQAQNVLLAGRGIEDVKVDLSGTAAANVLAVNLTAQPLRMSLRARGAYADDRWRGLVDAFELRDGDAVDLRLAEFAPLTLSRTSQVLGRTCLQGGGEARLCVRGDREAADWQAGLEAQNLPLRALTEGLSRATSYEGRIGLDLTAQGGPARLTDAKLTARLNDAELRHREPSGREQRVRLGTGSVDGSLTGAAYALRVGLDAGDSGKISGRVEGQRTGEDFGAWPINGDVELSTDALSLVDLLLDDVDRVAGRLNARLDIGGTIGEPRLAGSLQVQGGELDFYQVNLGVRGLQLDARLDDRALQLEGSLQAGAGSARIDGRIAWNGGEPHGQLALKGERLRLVDVPEARVDASPDLQFKIEGRRIDVTGEVDVPEAHLEPADITNAVLASGDEVLVGATPRNPDSQFQVASNIRLALGDKVTINTYGLTGRLTGTIATRNDESGIGRASGELNVTEGRYSAFGRNLDIERGRLLFNNGPVADPGIDLRAQKVYPDITAGVNVRGTLRAPRMTFFSEPAIPQSQIVSLILAGGSLESVQSSGRSNATRNDLLAQGGAILAQQFGSRVGIDDVSIESDLTNDTSLVLGRYLSPGLYVSYGISLAEAINIVKLRYTIGDHWTLKTESGRARSADIVYTIRK